MEAIIFFETSVYTSDGIHEVTEQKISIVTVVRTSKPTRMVAVTSQI
jgi:hypothetical protein